MSQFKADQFWEKRLSSISGLEGVGYAKLGPAFNKWAYKVRNAVFIREWKRLRLQSSPERVLDIGSGTGFYIALWHKVHAHSVSGADITDTAVSNLKKTFPEDKFHKLDIGGDISEFMAHNGTFDAVSCMDVLFHIVDDERYRRALHNIAALLKPGGLFLFSDNFVHAGTVRTQHQVSHSYTHLMKWLHEAGFEVVVRKPFMVVTNSPVDSKNPLLKAWWFLLENALGLIKPLGHLLGPPLYLLDTYLTDSMKEGVSSEFLILRKK
jgi:2-polyprenyl-3-methyl-5-hydroxy-6-metoxy-1,4-benzoquinol methylase